MLKLKRLTITKFRHVEPTELVFDDLYTVPLGINGSGKTTLLKLISACLRSDFSAYRDEEFDLEYAFGIDGDTFSIRVLNELRAANFPPQPMLSLGFDPPRLSSSATMTLERLGQAPFAMKLRDGLLYTDHPEARPGPPSGYQRAKMPVEGAFLAQSLFNAYGWLDQIEAWREGTRGFPGALFQASQCYRFDESLETLGSLTGAMSTRGDAPPATSAELFFSRKAHEGATPFMANIAFLPEELRRGLTPQPNQSQIDEGSIKFGSDDVNFLKDFARTAGFSSGVLTINLTRSDSTETWRTFSFKGISFRFKTAHEDALEHELLSYGQKRLLSFLYYVACNDAFIVADELVNGLHHAWIEVCLDAIGERQAFLTSQNPILLDFLPPASPEEAQRRFIRCVPEEREGRDVMVWRNLTPDEAKELCANYAAGVQQLSDLLRIQGLW
jgi:hypothetical protein